MVGAGLVAAQSELCSYVETVSLWSNGQRHLLKLNIDQHYSQWNVTFTFNADVTFEVLTTWPPVAGDMGVCAGVEGRRDEAVQRHVQPHQQVLQQRAVPVPVSGAGIPHPLPARQQSLSR